jgi:hypothetical protein
VCHFLLPLHYQQLDRREKTTAESQPLPTQGCLRQLLRTFLVFRRFDVINSILPFQLYHKIRFFHIKIPGRLPKYDKLRASQYGLDFITRATSERWIEVYNERLDRWEGHLF